MTCAEFARDWNRFVSNSLDDETRTLMEQHARICHECRKKVEDHKELGTAIQTVLETQKLPPEIPEQVTQSAYQKKFGTALNVNPLHSPQNAPATMLKAPMLVALLFGLIIGYVVSGNGSQMSLPQQLALRGMPRYGSNDFVEMMMYSEMMGGGVFGFSGSGMPSFSTTMRVLFFVCFLIWLAKTKLWETLFPAGVPVGVYVSRWLAILAAILGLAKASLTGLMSGVGLIATGGRGASVETEIQGWLPTLMVLDQLWSIAFWLTLTILFFTAANQILLRYANQLQASTR